MAKRKRKGLRGLGGTTAEHTSEAHRLLDASERARNAARQHVAGRGEHGKRDGCTFALAALSLSSRAEAEAAWVDDAELKRKVGNDSRRNVTFVRDVCGCKGSR